MASRDAFEQQLSQLNGLRADPNAPGADEALRRALAARSNLLVARAAEIIAEWELGCFEPELTAAFPRFLDDAARRDPTCAAKIAIVAALNRLETRDAELFLRGVGHVQPEPVWGGQVDTAARLRGMSALGLARSDPPETLLALARLLADPEPDARTGAARAIAYAARPGGAPLLWYKAETGDEEPAVMAEVFAALLSLEPVAALSLVGERAAGDDLPLAEAAVAALGGSGIPEALPVLTGIWETTEHPVMRPVALAAVASLGVRGHDGAFAFLLDLLTGGATRDAADALAALAPFRADARRERKIERALRRRDDLPPGA